jgi:methyl halide transferase
MPVVEFVNFIIFEFNKFDNRQTGNGQLSLGMDFIPGKNYWSARWKNKETTWDLGYPSPPLKAYFDRIGNKELRILIPGCGNAYEAEYLFRQGFKNVYVLDFAPEALAEFSRRVPQFPEAHLLCEDFFELKLENWDLVVEQTFFCALPPAQRNDYAEKMHRLLGNGGKLAGLFFTDPLNNSQPPFGATEAEYRAIFSPYFALDILEKAQNSIAPRAGRELFFEFRKKTNA